MVFTKSNIKFVGKSISIGEAAEMSLKEKNLICNIATYLITMKMRRKLFWTIL